MSKPRVLLLGDSIRMSYQPVVAELLAEAAEVVGPTENCQYSLYTLTRLDCWLAELGPDFDVIHWNNGLHDIGCNPNRRPMKFSVSDYVGNLELILKDKLLPQTAKVIWATNTPVHPNRPAPEDAWAWDNEEIDAYNAAALEVMQANAISVNDLNALVKVDFDGMLCDDRLHLSEAGQRRCGEVVAEKIRDVL